MAGIFLTAEWRKLAMANYPVDPGTLGPLVPQGTELDTWKGDCYVSLVGFQFIKVLVKGYRIPMHTNFPEVNLRFYVRYRDAGGWKRGVVFIREIVPLRAVSWLANTLFQERCISLPMRFEAMTTGGANAGQLCMAVQGSVEPRGHGKFRDPAAAASRQPGRIH